MDKLLEALETISSDDLAHMRTVLGMNTTASRQAVAKELVTIGGIDAMCSSLSGDELAVLFNLWRSKTGLTYSELCKAMQAEADHIDVVARSLTNRCMVYILKNRRHLNNRLDKLYLNPGIEEAFTFTTEEEFLKQVKELSDTLSVKGGKSTPEIPKKSAALATSLFEAGGLSTYRVLSEQLGRAALDAALSEAQSKGLVTVSQTNTAPFATLVLLTPKAMTALISRKGSAAKSPVNNRYALFNNILRTYDIISSRGLYLTQQRDFRKADFKRISDALLPMFDHRGMSLDPDDTTRLCLHLLNRISAVTIRKDALHIDLSNIEKDLSTPERLHSLFLKASLKKSPDESIFASPFPAPTSDEIQMLVDFITENSGNDLSTIRASFILGRLTRMPHVLSQVAGMGALPGERFNCALRYAVLFGMVRIDESSCSTVPTPETHEASSYINPDFTLMIPADDIPQDVLYRILSCTELTKNDVVLHCRITRDSVLSAHKRRMHPDRYISEFAPFLKNSVPQNLTFMVSEWIAQSLEVDIQDVVLLRTNHPAFIDDLLTGALKSAVVERISPNYAIVRRASLDDITRFAAKHSALTTLFTKGE